MVRWLQTIVPHLPAALLLLFGGWAGTFHVGAEARWALAGHLALWAFAAAFGGPGVLRLGWGGRLLLAALAVSVLASHLASPVTRAGRLGVLLLPALALVPAAVARCWASADARRRGLRSLSLVVVVVAIWSLVGWWCRLTPGASLPFGHHGLLAAWLLATLPLAVLPWRDGGAGRVIAAAAGVLGLAALLGTRSLAAVLAAGVVVAVLAVRYRKGWLGLAALATLAAAQLPRLGAILEGTDASVAARWSYLQAGWRGLLERPILGWGPGASRWTLPEHLRPTPGVHAPDQVVADVHSLPLQLAYELGWSGLLLIVGLAVIFLRQRPEVSDPALRRAALTGLAALALVSFAGRPLAATAIPLAAMIGLGAVLAAETPPARRSRRGRLMTAGVVAASAVLVVPLDLAHLAYDRAVHADDPERQTRHLLRAVALDPAFPLYRARLAWLEADLEAARDAAEGARGVTPLWTVAGILAQDAGEPWSREALLRACRLSPLAVVAPYRLTFEQGSEEQRAQWAARALLAEPLVAAAVAWRDRGPMLRAAVGEIGRLDAVDPGWRDWLEGVVAAREEGGQDATRVLALAMDADPATSPSLYAFRRRPWPIDLARIEIDSWLLASVDPGAAAVLSSAETDPEGRERDVFQDPFCGLAAP